ncbi:glutamyl-tRNA synthetase [Gyrodon lividus]|nr:glutamyl-tRNA synthetase [Gyrodon lividus]
MVLLRFAPSPTGALHLGGLRTALYNHLFAKKHGGKWILRIEDTDATRYVPGAVDGIRSALTWAGLSYDFGPGLDGPHGPYYQQSERLDLYHLYTRRLIESGHAYHCFCSPDKLASTRERLARTGSNATYDKACLHLTEEEVARRVRAGEKSIVRLNDENLPERVPTHDIVFGSLRDAHASLPTDPVLLKSDLFPTYHLASVVDDHEMGITHVVRGEEWLPSLPLHLDLYSCLSLKPPQFAHLPILLNPDGSKMSKRKGDVAVLAFMRRGWEPEAMINWLALAGWGQSPRSSFPESIAATYAPDSTTVMTLPELTEQFDLASLTHRRHILDPVKLEYLNKHHLMRSWKSDQGTSFHAHRVHHLVRASFPSSQYTTPEYIAKVIHVLQGRITNINDVPVLAPYFYIDPDYATPEAQLMRLSISTEDYRRALDVAVHHLAVQPDASGISDLGVIVHSACDATGLKQKVFMTALRHALSGMKTGPSIPETIDVLGMERTISRLKGALI